MIRMSARRAPREISMPGKRSLRLRRTTDMAIRVNRTAPFAPSSPDGPDAYGHGAAARMRTASYRFTAFCERRARHCTPSVARRLPHDRFRPISYPVAYTTDARVTLRQTSVPPALHDSRFTRR